AHLFSNFNVGAIERADGHGTIHGEFHVAGARRFFACRRDLLGEIGGGINMLGEFDVEIGQEHNFEPTGNVRVVVNDIGHAVNQFDNELGHEVARRGFTAEDKCPGNNLEILVALQSVIECNYVENIQVLALVFVNALYLNVEEGVRIHDDAGTLLYQIRQL